jgi:hypothetical protein
VNGRVGEWGMGEWDVSIRDLLRLGSPSLGSLMRELPFERSTIDQEHHLEIAGGDRMV